METLQNQLIKLSEYDVGFKIHDGKFYVGIRYKKGWTIINPTDDVIKFIPDKNKENTYYYTAPVDDGKNLDKIFNEVNTVIDYNKELEEKIALFKIKMEELQKIFAEKPITELNTLSFTFGVEDKKTTTKKTKKVSGTKKRTKKGTDVKSDDVKEEVSKEDNSNVEQMDSKIEDRIKKVNGTI